MTSLIRRLVPAQLIQLYHRGVAVAASLWFGLPSRKMIVIGVTGTDGKTTTVTMIVDLLMAAGYRVGLSSTVYYQVGDKRWLNESHMTMPGRFGLQQLLRRMVKAQCQFAVIEVSSEGLAQSRHIGIDFDAAVITNLSPEHLKTHRTFDRYRRAKELLFGQIIKGGDKRGPDGLPAKKVSVVNLDDSSAEHFLKFWAEEHYGVTMQQRPPIPAIRPEKVHVWRAENIHHADDRSTFEVAGHSLELPLPGDYNVMNALEALAVASAYGVDWPTLAKGLRTVKPIPGRWQEVPTGKPWRVIIDYALTPRALTMFYQALKQEHVKRIIAVFGAAGGGRDTWKRPELGKIAGEHADVVILTTDDPYDDDPAHIAGEIMAGVGADKRGEVEVILDRRLAIRRAMEVAQPGDVIAITGMGAETSMVVQGQKVPWNDASVVQDLLKNTPFNN